MDISVVREQAALNVFGHEVTIEGRVLNIRCLGKISFLLLSDITGSIQVCLRSKILPSNWDIIRVTGVLNPSKTGEITVWTHEFQLIAHCEGSVPEKYHGLTDKEIIYSKRYVDIIGNEESRKIFSSRPKALWIIRRELNQFGYLEIETPILLSEASGANAQPFVTRHNTYGKDMALRIATEVNLKKAIISGFPKVFELGKVFRNEGVSIRHSPEFTSIEIYAAHETVEAMLHLFTYLADSIAYELGLARLPRDLIEIPRFEYDELVSKYGEDFDQHLQDLTFVTGHPIEQTPFCKTRPDGKSDRFEVYWKGMEIAEIYNEINDWREQEARLNGREDDGLVEAMKYGMPPTAGMGIGIDRLLMCLFNQESIRDVIMFPTRKPA